MYLFFWIIYFNFAKHMKNIDKVTFVHFNDKTFLHYIQSYTDYLPMEEVILNNYNRYKIVGYEYKGFYD